MEQREPIINTPRLELHHIRADHLIELYEKRNDASALRELNFTNPFRNLIDFQGPLAWRVPQVRENSAVNKWFVRWIVLKQSQEVIGSISFHGAPDQDGMLEIGLGIEGNFQNQGYGKEALQGMWNWATTFSEVQIFRYTASPDNKSSIALINYFGFEFKGQQLDEVDGLENIYEIRTLDYERKWGDRNE